MISISMSLDIIFLGAPGSGKGTQSDIVCREFNLKHIATGDLFRYNLKNQTELGQLAKSYMDKGILVPDDITAAMVRDRLSNHDTNNGVILDGFPRTIPQAKALIGILSSLNRQLSKVLHINVSDEEIINRLSGRWICRQCQMPYHTMFKPPAQTGICDSCGGELYQRNDDKPETIKTRLQIFYDLTAPLIDYYQTAGLLVEINGEGDISDITNRTLSVIHELANRQFA